MLKKEIEIVN